MYDDNAKAPGETMPMVGEDLSPRQEPVEVRLGRKLLNLEREVENVKRALKVLRENPKILETLNCLRRVGV